MNNASVDQEFYISHLSLSGFFIEITEYIYEKKQRGDVTATAYDMASSTLSSSASKENDYLNSISETIDLMADLGWLDIHAIGTTFDDKVLYKFNP